MLCVKKKKAALDGPEIYHERQTRELCALHALNNLFQKRNAFTKKQLDEICQNLAPNSFVNPHRSFLGLGNYDVNVIMAALQLRDYETMWFDKRRSVSDLDLSQIYGFILNIPSDLRVGFLSLPVLRKHWIAVRRVDGAFYNLDSKLDAPERIGAEEKLTEYLRERVASKDTELLVVISQAESDRGWVWKTAEDTSPDKPLESTVGPGDGWVESGV